MPRTAPASHLRRTAADSCKLGRRKLLFAFALQDKEGLPLTCRAVFIVGPDKKLKLSLNYPASVGRNMDGEPEIALRWT
jgi:hypothetical protein